MIYVKLMARRPEYNGEWRTRNTFGRYGRNDRDGLAKAMRDATSALVGWWRCEPATEFEVIREEK
jgi:hypothetical protein